MVKKALAAASLALSAAEANPQQPIEFTAVFIKSPHGYVGFVEELPGVNSHGRTLDEAREMLGEVAVAVFDAERQRAQEMLAGKECVREPLTMAAQMRGGE
jgi:predicted RNase H-like HicB family nuclease